MTTTEAVNTARELYAEPGQIEIEDRADATVQADGQAWVQAWVRVPISIEQEKAQATTSPPSRLYDYTTRTFVGACIAATLEETILASQGWERVWADVTQAKTFVVFRKAHR